MYSVFSKSFLTQNVLDKRAIDLGDSEKSIFHEAVVQMVISSKKCQNHPSQQILETQYPGRVFRLSWRVFRDVAVR